MFNFFSRSSKPIDIWFDTDIHCHLIPGIDDGSKDVETSCRLIGQIQELGVKNIIATPHVTEGTFENTAETIGAALSTLRAEMERQGLDIPLTHSAEYRIDDLFKQNFAAGTLMPYPKNYLLIENSFIQEPWNLDELIFALKIKGFKPILAHPERYPFYHAHPNRYKALHENVLFQINLLSLSGYYGKAVKKVAEWLISEEMVDFIGTDLHGQSHVNSIREYLSTRDARQHRDKTASVILNDTILS